MSTNTFTFRVKLMVIEPPVARTFKARSNTTLYEFHHIIQAIMGWTNSHLYEFDDGERVIADTRLMDNEMGPVLEAKEVTLDQVFKQTGDWMRYEYDFGDGWLHRIELLEISASLEGESLPVILDGFHACPPENCGGPFGYIELKEKLLNPKHPDYKSTKKWVGAAFDPLYFDPTAAQKKLNNMSSSIAEYEQGF